MAGAARAERPRCSLTRPAWSAGVPQDGPVGAPRAARPWPGAAQPGLPGAGPRTGAGASRLLSSGKGAAAPSSSESAAGEVRDQLRRRRVEADDVEHARIVRVG